ncbi:MAG: hypothetical protein K0U98_14960 [Deltaproteobacteria bacterium]|nr:hypothetical protein [Deltaproteobacteria bacterium]
MRLVEFSKLFRHLCDSDFVRTRPRKGGMGVLIEITPDGLQALDLVGELSPGGQLEPAEMVALAILALRPTSIKDLGRSLDLTGPDSISLVCGLAAGQSLWVSTRGTNLNRVCFITSHGRSILELRNRKRRAS